MRLDAAGCTKPKKTVSTNDFSAFRCMIRRDNFNTILKCGHLFHQYITDMYAKIEAECSDGYIHLKDAVRGANTRDLGQLIILPYNVGILPHFTQWLFSEAGELFRIVPNAKLRQRVITYATKTCGICILQPMLPTAVPMRQWIRSARDSSGRALKKKGGHTEVTLR